MAGSADSWAELLLTNQGMIHYDRVQEAGQGNSASCGWNRNNSAQQD